MSDRGDQVEVKDTNANIVAKIEGLDPDLVAVIVEDNGSSADVIVSKYLGCKFNSLIIAFDIFNFYTGPNKQIEKIPLRQEAKQQFPALIAEILTGTNKPVVITLDNSLPLIKNQTGLKDGKFVLEEILKKVEEKCNGYSGRFVDCMGRLHVILYSAHNYQNNSGLYMEYNRIAASFGFRLTNVVGKDIGRYEKVVESLGGGEVSEA